MTRKIDGDSKYIPKYLGAMLGLAIGDAMGAPIEGLSPDQFEPVVGFQGGGQHDLEPGQWTDDTSMALCLAESLIECRGFDATDQMERYVRWYQDGYLSSTGTAFGYGATTRRALERFITWRTPYVGETGDDSASNGSLVRIAPIPMLFRKYPEIALKYARDSSRTTHGNVVVLEACQYLAALMIKALNGADKGEVLFGDLSGFTGFVGRSSLVNFAEELRNCWRERTASEMEPSAYVLDTLSCALWALSNSSSLEDGLLLAVNLGGDADSVGAVYGQLAGAIYGIQNIPELYKDGICQFEILDLFAQRLMQAASNQSINLDA